MLTKQFPTNGSNSEPRLAASASISCQPQHLFPSILNLLKACNRSEDLEGGKRIYVASGKHGFDAKPFVANSRIRMYSKCGSMDNARHVFDGLSHRDLVSWNVMLATNSQVQQADLALQIYDRMRHEGDIPDTWTFVSALLACGTLAEKEKSEVLEGQHLKVESVQRGKQIHAHASSVGFMSDVLVGSTLVSIYAKCGTFEHAQYVFDSLPQHNMVVCNAMLAACVQHDEGKKSPADVFCRTKASYLIQGLLSAFPKHAAFLQVRRRC